jgi:hypothetical protein
MRNEVKDSGLVWLTLFISSSTLLCCTLPVLLVALGFGASLAILTTRMHWWITLAEYKFWLFFCSAALLLMAYWALRRTKGMCPVDPVLAKKCKHLQKWNSVVYYVSVFIWVVGFFSAYLAVPIASLFE